MDDVTTGAKKYGMMFDERAQKLLVFGILAMVLLLSIYVATKNNLFFIVSFIPGMIGLPMDGLTFLLVVAGLALALAWVRQKSRMLPIRISWLFFVPSLACFSQIDWFYLIGIPTHLFLRSSAPDLVILMNGAAIICGGVLVRSFQNVQIVRANLMKREGNRREVDQACGKDLLFVAKVLAGISGFVVVAWIAVTALAPAVTDLSTPYGSDYIWMAAIPMVAVVAIFIFLIVGRDMGEKKRMRG